MKALLVIDIQNDYFDGGKFPLWNTENTLSNIQKAILNAKKNNVEVIFIQHISNPDVGIAPFFNGDTDGVKIHQALEEFTSTSTIVEKSYADGFYKTNLDDVLKEKNIDELLICGMMTQNCVTHTAISKTAEKYKTTIITDCCTTINEAIHAIALNAVSTRVPLISLNDISW